MSNYNKVIIEQKLAYINMYYPYWHNGIIIKNLEELSVESCNNCSETCCERFPCTFLPSDFGGNLNDKNYVKLILKSGLVSVSRLFQEKTVSFVLRPRHIWEKSKVKGNYIPLIHNRCILLSHDGCILPRELRPTEGLLYNCKMNDKLLIYEIEKSWRPYQETLKEIYKEYKNKYLLIPNITEEKVKEFQKVMMISHY